ncbi:TRAP transporter large permease [Chloroflexota bacterium]
MNTLAAGIAILLIFMLLRAPVAIGFAAASTFYLIAYKLGFSFAASAIFHNLDSFPLMAIPFFILAGTLMGAGGISVRLVNFVHSLAGRLRGGLGSVTVVSTMLFGAISGSSVSAIGTIGTVMLPRLEERGFPKNYATALISCSGVLGQLIPPSIPMIIYGMVTETSIAALFLATAVPGLLLGVIYVLLNTFICGKFPQVLSERVKGISLHSHAKLVLKTGAQAFFGLLMPVVILGGIYGGIFTPTEAACVAVVYALPVGLWIYKGLNLKSIFRCFIQAASTTGTILIILTFVTVFVRVLILQQVPQELTIFISEATSSPFLILLMVNLFLLIVGMIMDDVNGTLLSGPLLLPIVALAGVGPIQLGAIIGVNLGMGLVTPPVSSNLFMGSRVSGLPISAFMRWVVPFILIGEIPVLLLTTYVPEVSLWLPNLIMGPGLR